MYTDFPAGTDADMLHAALFAAAVALLDDLRRHGWVKVTRRPKPRAALPDGLPDGCRRVDRVTATRHGRWRYIATWPNVW